MTCCRGFDNAVARQFDPAVAQRDLGRYRRRGADQVTRMLRDQVLRQGPRDRVLDVGAGVGALSFELLAVGFDRAEVVEASPAYLEAARAEAARRGLDERIRFHQGDFVVLADTLRPAGAVTLNRVVCCYPEYLPLLEAALARSAGIFAFSYPRERWYIRLAVRLHNALRRFAGNPFRVYLHDVERMQAVIAGRGFRVVGRGSTVVWRIETYRGPGPRLEASDAGSSPPGGPGTGAGSGGGT